MAPWLRTPVLVVASGVGRIGAHGSLPAAQPIVLTLSRRSGQRHASHRATGRAGPVHRAAARPS